MSYVNCNLCPRRCGVDRTAGEKGFCGGGDKAMVAKTMLHKWEEPILAGAGGSGAIFFGGCTLGCRYCQNRTISARPVGQTVDGEGLRKMMDTLLAQGAENIDLVTPTHYLPTALQALEKPLPVPVIYNCGGYENPESIEKLAGKVDIFLPDMKYADPHLAKTLSGAEDYFPVAAEAVKTMVKVAGKPVFDGNRLKKGVVIRHLILPGHVENSLKVLDWIGETFAPDEVLVSLMRQYTPMGGMASPFDRKITDAEYDAVLCWMYLNGLNGFTQEDSAADSSFIPEF